MDDGQHCQRLFGKTTTGIMPLTNADLAGCHVQAEKVVADGRTYDYAYRRTREYPYTLSCFSGQLFSETRHSIRESMGPLRQRGAYGRRPLHNR